MDNSKSQTIVVIRKLTRIQPVRTFWLGLNFVAVIDA